MTGMISKEAAQGLAVSYGAYTASVSAGNHKLIVKNGELLLNAQQETGITLIDENTINTFVSNSKSKLGG